ncbi:heat shock transcription factor, X-linked [Sorex araneus]|uniref:heat shock transcription factor, X-linked n=1 Tax=Sorex araneus TaxID=42254 RepID=UPI00243385BE|nr:heat shock transcription factor, X-linked [Sorex araneus]
MSRAGFKGDPLPIDDVSPGLASGAILPGARHVSERGRGQRPQCAEPRSRPSPEEAAGMASPARAQTPGEPPPGCAEQGPSAPAARAEPSRQGTASPRGSEPLPTSPASPGQRPEGASVAPPPAAAATQGSPGKEGSLETPSVFPYPESQARRRRRRRRMRKHAQNQFLYCHFPKKLWRMVSSDRFQSIRWAEDGTCICIDKQLFQREVLDKQGPDRIFHTSSMKNFERQLNLYGFTRVRAQTQSYTCLLTPEANGRYNFSKIHYYINPSFKRDNPNLLKQMRRRVRRSRRLCLDSAWNYQSSSTAVPPAQGPTLYWQQHLPSAPQGPPAPPIHPQGGPAAGLQEPNSGLPAPGAAQLDTAHESSRPIGGAHPEATEASSPRGQAFTVVVPHPVIVRPGQDPLWAVGPVISMQSLANGPEQNVTVLVPVPVVLPVLQLRVHLLPPQADPRPL